VIAVFDKAGQTRFRAVRQGAEDRGTDLIGSIGARVVDEVSEVVSGTAERRDDDGASCSGGLERREAGSLEPARKYEDARGRIGRGEERVVMFEATEPVCEPIAQAAAGLSVGLVSRNRVADDDEGHAGPRQGGYEAEDVLAGLDAADIEDEFSIGVVLVEERGRASGEALVDGVRNDGDLVARDAE
jgi:hypothetical protein